MYEYIFEIYDKRYHCWVIDYKTSNEDIACYYFQALLRENDKSCVRVITRFKLEA